MTTSPHPNDDPFDLSRFLRAQDQHLEQALGEIRAGRKQTHWIWFVFPTFDGLSQSATSRRYAIKSLDEAKAFLAHPILGARLLECVEALMGAQDKTANEILGSPDDRKVQGCATLFAHVSPADSAFERLLARFYGGERDAATLELLDAS